MVTREQYILNLRSMFGVPYLWGGFSEKGVDCSGLASLCLGLTAKRNAAELYHDYRSLAVRAVQAAQGSLYFYGDDINHIEHVMSVLEHWQNGYIILVGACHGDATTINLDVAKAQGAYVMTKDQSYWLSHFQVACDPFDGAA